MSYRTRKGNTATLLASIIFIIVIAAFAAAAYFIFGGEPVAQNDPYPWITSDHAANDGMLDGSYYTGEKNESGILSYKISGEVTVGKDDGKGNFKIENSGKNDCLIRVKILLDDGRTVYETGYIKPNQHIDEDVLGIIPEVGSHPAKAYFEGINPHTEESLGSAVEEITITVIE